MKNRVWFYKRNDAVAHAHRAAYEKSLNCNHAVKVHSGQYYYKGFEVSKDGGRECPWNYCKVGADDFFREAAETKKLALEYIDCIIKDETRAGA
jgi:hypothetical protein